MTSENINKLTLTVKTTRISIEGMISSYRKTNQRCSLNVQLKKPGNHINPIKDCKRFSESTIRKEIKANSKQIPL